MDSENFKSTGLTRKISNILATSRRYAIGAIKDELVEAINYIGLEMERAEEEYGGHLYFQLKAGGFNEDQLNTFYEKYRTNEVEKWIYEGADGEINDIIIRFIDFRQMNRNGLRQRFPCTFLKWTPQDDEDLRAIWTRTDQSNPNWPDLEEMFGRPRNAIKIRLEKLGFTLAEPAVRRYS